MIISRLGLGGVGEIPIYRTSVIMNDLNLAGATW